VRSDWYTLTHTHTNTKYVVRPQDPLALTIARGETQKSFRDEYIEQDNKREIDNERTTWFDDSGNGKGQFIGDGEKGKKWLSYIGYTSKRRARNRLSTPLGFDL